MIYKKLNHRNKQIVYIHNEIFDELKECEMLTNQQKIFAYAYYGVIAYLYRYCKYDFGQLFNNEDIKEMLGYKRSYGGVDFIIKRGGVLDYIGMMESIRDFPVDCDLSEDGVVSFTMWSELDSVMQAQKLPSAYFIKKPMKVFDRDETGAGTYNNISYTHPFDMSVLMSMIRQGLGLGEFYLYQYLKMRSFLFKDGYVAGLAYLRDELGVSVATIIKYTSRLEKSGYLHVKRGEKIGRNTPANVYLVK